MSTLLPSASFSSIPKSSTNAPLVPDPSSRERMVISPDAPVWSELSAVLSFPLLPHPTMVPSANVATRSVAAISFNFIFDLLLSFWLFLSISFTRHMIQTLCKMKCMVSVKIVLKMVVGFCVVSKAGEPGAKKSISPAFTDNMDFILQSVFCYNAEPTFPTPCAIRSILERCLPVNRRYDQSVHTTYCNNCRKSSCRSCNLYLRTT